MPGDEGAAERKQRSLTRNISILAREATYTRTLMSILVPLSPLPRTSDTANLKGAGTVSPAQSLDEAPFLPSPPSLQGMAKSPRAPAPRPPSLENRNDRRKRMWWVAEGEKRDAAEHGPRECRQPLALVFPCANGILTEKSRYTELPSRAMGWGRVGKGGR